MFGPRDRFFAEIIIARGLATADAVRQLALRLSDQEPGTFPRALEAGGLISPIAREALEREVDRLRRTCTCGEVFYVHERAPNACPRCRRVQTARDSMTQVDRTPPPPPTRAPAPPPSPDPVASAFADPPPPKKRFGPYVVVEELGRGGMGVVFKAKQEPIGREVALKALLEVKGKRRERFFREARAAARISHPNVVKVHDVGEEEGIVYYSMDLVHGKPLDVILITEGALPAERAVAITEGLARAVHAVHEAGLVHRDLKPGNVIIQEDDSPLLIDFGLARELQDDGERLTKTGVAVGTPHYMSPEQVRGIRADVDHRTDVWALGVILFELMAGERPFKGESASELYASIQNTEAPRLRSIRPEAPESVDAIIAKTLERDKRLRYGSALELALELERVRQGTSAEANSSTERAGRTRRRLARTLRRVGPVALALLIAFSVGGLALGIWWRSAREAHQRKTSAEREKVQKQAQGAVANVQRLADESLRTMDPGEARTLATDAFATLDALPKTLADGIATDGGKAEIAAQLDSPDARKARRTTLGARGRAALLHGGPRELLAAEKDLASAREGAAADADLAAIHAEILLALGRGADADRALASALSSRPAGDPQLARLEAAARLVRGDTPGALAGLDALLGAHPNETRARVLRARARLRAGDEKGALEDADAAARESDPHASEAPGAAADRKTRDDATWIAARALGVEARLALGRTDEAWTQADELAKLRPDDPVAVRALARALGARGDDEQAVRALGRALQKQPDEPLLLAARGEAHAVLLEDAAARADLSAAAERAVSPRAAAELWVELAALSDAAQDPATAVADLERATKAADADPGARAFVGVARARRELLVARSASLAAEDLAAAAREGEPVAGTSVVQALIALAQKDAGPALEAAIRAESEDARDLLALAAEIDARHLRGETDAATKAARELATREERASDTAGRLLRRASSLARAAAYAPDPVAARPLWASVQKRAMRAVSLGPGRPGPLALAGVAAGKLDAPGEARRLLARALELGSEDALAQLWDGHVRLAAKDAAGAARSLSRAVALSPGDLGEDPLVWHELACARALAKDWTGADEAGHKALELEPESADAVAVLAEAARGRGDTAHAAEWVARWKLLTGDGTKRANELDQQGLELLFHKHPTEAKRRFEQALELAPHSWALWWHLAMACTESGEQIPSFLNFVHALECDPYPDGKDPEEFVHLQAAKLKMIANVSAFVGELEQQLEDTPRAPHLQFLVGYCEWGRTEFFGEESPGSVERAIAHFDRAIAIDPRFALAYAYRGHMRRLRGELGPAREDLERSVALSRGRMAVGHVFRAGLEASIGDGDLAQRELEAALREGFADKWRILADPALARVLQDRPALRARVEKLPDVPVAEGFADGF